MRKTFIIAEAGVNHNGSAALARKLVLEASRAGADAVKFQTFTAGALVTRSAPAADYQRRAVGLKGQYEMIRRLELAPGLHRELMRYCRMLGICFMSSAFDLGSLDLLRKMGLSTFKIPSGEITNLPYLRKVGSFRRQILLSTGMATMAEIARALETLVKAGTARSRITLLQCTTAYPARFADVNLRAMRTLGERFGVDVGYSDHTPGIEAAVAAAALGARVIEKHFTLSRTLTGPDHAASLDPEGFAAMVRAVRHVEEALGSCRKSPGSEELKNRKVVRKSIVAAVDISAGERFTECNVTVKRPEGGIDPMRWDTVIGKKARRDFRIDERITL